MHQSPRVSEQYLRPEMIDKCPLYPAQPAPPEAPSSLAYLLLSRAVRAGCKSV